MILFLPQPCALGVCCEDRETRQRFITMPSKDQRTGFIHIFFILLENLIWNLIHEHPYDPKLEKQNN